MGIFYCIVNVIDFLKWYLILLKSQFRFLTNIRMYFMHLISLYFIHAKTQTTFLTLIHVFKLCFDILIILWICIFMMSIYYNNMILFKEYASEFESYQNIAPEWYFYYTQTHLMVRFTTALSTVMFRYCIENRFSAT